MHKPFTHAQAEEICEDFEDLVDTEIIMQVNNKPLKCYIDHVAIVPWHSAGKTLFMQAYKESGSVRVALENYSGDDFDVLIIASNADDENEVITQNIEDYILKNGVNYNFPE